MGQLAVEIGRQAAVNIAQSAAANAIVGALGEELEGPRLEALQLQSSSEGAGLPLVYGRVRVGGQIIWATRFKEKKTTTESGGKGGPKVTEYTYSASFAVALGVGPINGLGRIWADGRPLRLDDVTWRLYRGDEAQTPDPLIEAVEGTGDVPAFRGVAYVVFEDLPLDAFGDRIPQLNFEVFRAPETQGSGPKLEDLARGVTLIPGSGEFAYATTVVRREGGLGVDAFENLNNARGKADVLAALDDLQTHLPNCRSVMIVTSWFGSDLRAGQCLLQPGVETQTKTTRGLTWSVAGVKRDQAYLVSQTNGRPNYGGTPDDASLIEAITELKARGFSVALYPFILMDIASDNTLADPYGGAAQAAFPWRGRITCDPAPGQPGSADKTAAAASQIGAFFGAAAASDFNVDGSDVTYAGPSEWSLRRMTLHYAHLAQAAGGVDAFVIASEMRGLTTVRDQVGAYPAVAALRSLATDVKSVVGASTVVTYAADWSEYFGHHPQDGSGDVHFHLDPLWSDAAIDVVGVDWYAPLSDWRDGSAHLDAQSHDSLYDHAYLAANIEGGEGYAWHYPTDADRTAQSRAPITDDADKPWVFRYKDLRSWWSNLHYDRPGGVESATPTAWSPQSKPIWFVEAGCPAVDKGPNQPNVFYDPKSAESALPYFSNGRRDDLIQRRALEALLDYWRVDGPNNPVSSVYQGPMIAADSIHLWTWDARPFPDFPARSEVWSDGANWTRGHWLNGRMGLAPLSTVVRDLCAKAGFQDADVDAGDLRSLVAGYILSGPVTARAALEPLAEMYRFAPAETATGLRFTALAASSVGAVSLADAVEERGGGRLTRTRGDASAAPVEARVRFYDEARDYQVAAASARRQDGVVRRVRSVSAPLVLDHGAAEDAALALLLDAQADTETVRVTLPPARLSWEAGDVIDAAELGGAWRITAVEEGLARGLTLTRASHAGPVGLAGATPGALTAAATPPSRPFGAVLDVPLLPGENDRVGPRVIAAATPWPGGVSVSAGASGGAQTARARLTTPGIMGRLVWDLWSGPVGRWDDGNVTRISVAGGTLSSASKADTLAGANAFAVFNDQAAGGGAWEVFQAREALLVSPGVYELRGLLRGQAGTETAMGAPVAAGALVVALNGASAATTLEAHERGESLSWRFTPDGTGGGAEDVYTISATHADLAHRPLAPVHVRAKREAGGVRFSWVRRTRIDGDDWAAADPPLGESEERYTLEVLQNGVKAWSAEVTTPQAFLSTADEAAAFPDAPRSDFQVRVAQISASFGPGVARDLTVYVSV